MLPYADENPTRRPAIVTGLLIATCVAVYFLVQPQQTSAEGVEFTFEYAAIPCELTEGRPLTQAEIAATVNAGVEDACGLPGDPTPPAFPGKNVWLAGLVSMFLHGSIFHLAGNMLFLWIFGNNVEDHLGVVRYVLFYVAAGAAATAAHVLVQLDSSVPVIGASGAIAGVMGAYLVWFPWARVRTFVLLGIFPLFVAVPAAALLILWFISQFFIGPDQGVAWMAHVGGFAFGVVFGLLARLSPRFNRGLWVARYASTGTRWDSRRGGWV